MRSFILIALIAVSGCVDRQSFLKRPSDGQIVRCDAKGWGIIPAMMELSNMEDCETYYMHEGFIKQ